MIPYGICGSGTRVLLSKGLGTIDAGVDVGTGAGAGVGADTDTGVGTCTGACIGVEGFKPILTGAGDG